MSRNSKIRDKIRRTDPEAPPIPMACFYCAASNIYDTTWHKDAENFWRCQWGHLANTDQVGILMGVKGADSL